MSSLEQFLKQEHPEALQLPKKEEKEEKGELILMRGLPGSGKSSKARAIASQKKSCAIYSTDDYFLVLDPPLPGQEDKEQIVFSYKFDAAKLHGYHKKNENRVEEAMKSKSHKTIIVDNCNATASSMKSYIKLAQLYNYSVSFEYPNTDWAANPKECAKRNTHSVPLEAIEKTEKSFLPKAACFALIQ